MPSIAQLEKLLAADANDAFVLYGLAQEHAKLGDLTKSIAYFDRCIAADPSYCYAYYHKARVQERAGDAADAILTIDAGLAAAKKAGDAHAAEELAALREGLA